MRFEKMTRIVLSAKKSESRMAAAGTTIETKVMGFWKTDGYDDKVPMAV